MQAAYKMCTCCLLILLCFNIWTDMRVIKSSCLLQTNNSLLDDNSTCIDATPEPSKPTQPQLKSVIVSISLEMKFVALLPLIIPAWRSVGFEPAFVFFACENVSLLTTTSVEGMLENITLVTFKQHKVKYHLIRVDRSFWRPGISRYIAAGMQHPDEIVMIADADLIPLNREYFDAISGVNIPKSKTYYDWDYDYAIVWKPKCTLPPAELKKESPRVQERCQHPFRVRSCYVIGQAQTFHELYPYESLYEAFVDLYQEKYFKIYKRDYKKEEPIYNNFDEYLSTALSMQQNFLELHPNGFRNHSKFPIMGEGGKFSGYSWTSSHTHDEFQQYLRVATDVHFKKEVFKFEDKNGAEYEWLRIAFENLGFSYPLQHFEALHSITHTAL